VTKKGSYVTACSQQSRGLRLDPPHVLLDVSVVVIADGLLANLSSTDIHHRTCEDGNGLRRIRKRSLLVCLGEIEIADDDRRFVAQLGGDSRPAAPQRRLDRSRRHERGLQRA